MSDFSPHSLKKKNVFFCFDNPICVINTKSEITQTGCPDRRLCSPVTHQLTSVLTTRTSFFLEIWKAKGLISQRSVRYLQVFHQPFSHADEDSRFLLEAGC